MSVYATHKKARFDYEILETFEGGIVLSGQEVKAVREGAAKLVGAFVTFHGGYAMLTNAHIPTYSHAAPKEEYDPLRSRIILLSKREIAYLRGKSEERGLTIIPLSLYTKGRRIKLEIALARGKKTRDKRETIKKRELDKDMRRQMKGTM